MDKKSCKHYLSIYLNIGLLSGDHCTLGWLCYLEMHCNSIWYARIKCQLIFGDKINFMTKLTKS